MSNQHIPAPAVLSVAERGELRQQASAELMRIRAVQATLAAQARPLIEMLDEIQALDDTDLVAGRPTSDFWNDAAFRQRVLDRDWNRGLGNPIVEPYVRRVVSDLAPAGIRGYATKPADDYTAIERFSVQLGLDYRQNVTEIAAALTRIHPLLADENGVMHVDIFEHTCSENGSDWHLMMPTAGTAGLWENSHYMLWDGDLIDVLEWTAAHHWYAGGPRTTY